MRKIIIKRVKHDSENPSQGNFMFNIQGDNGEVIASSETYVNKQDLYDTVEKYFAGYEIVDVSVN